MGFRFSAGFGPVRYSTRLGGSKDRRAADEPSVADGVARAFERGGQHLLDHQARTAERHSDERPQLVSRAEELKALVGHEERSEIEERLVHLASAVDGTVQYLSRARKLRRLLDRIEGRLQR